MVESGSLTAGAARRCSEVLGGAREGVVNRRDIRTTCGYVSVRAANKVKHGGRVHGAQRARTQCSERVKTHLHQLTSTAAAHIYSHLESSHQHLPTSTRLRSRLWTDQLVLVKRY